MLLKSLVPHLELNLQWCFYMTESIDTTNYTWQRHFKQKHPTFINKRPIMIEEVQYLNWHIDTLTNEILTVLNCNYTDSYYTVTFVRYIFSDYITQYIDGVKLH